jgi:hypothetical protein
MHFILIQIKFYTLLTYYYYTGEQKNTLVNHFTTEFERGHKYGMFDV